MKFTYSVDGGERYEIEAPSQLNYYDWSALAECAAEDFHYSRGGWEWSHWPQEIVLHLSNDIVVEVNREVVPQFTATRIHVKQPTPNADSARMGPRSQGQGETTTPEVTGGPR